MRLSDELLTRFRDWLAAAEAAGVREPTAMSLSTLSETGVSARMVLLKEVTRSGFVFYTNLESLKGRQLAANPASALTFHWDAIERQVRVEGRAHPVSDGEADAYFATRPRGSQLGAWASDQSRPLSGNAELLKRVARTEARFLGGSVPRPPYWSGYRVEPEMIEFWQGRKSRLHKRLRYTPDGGAWREERLFP